MIFTRIKSEGIVHITYLVGSDGDAAVIDPRRDFLHPSPGRLSGVFNVPGSMKAWEAAGYPVSKD